MTPPEPGLSNPLQRVALIHATALAMAPIAQAFERHWPLARRMNLLDDSLSQDLALAGSLQPGMVQRLVDLAFYARSTGCDGILFTCSAFGPAIEAAGVAVGLPTLKPNEAMFEQALDLAATRGAKLGLLATFEPSIASMSAELQALARQRGQQIALECVFVPEAMQDLARGDSAAHDRKIVRAAQQLHRCGVVMLAQFSMAAARDAVQQVMGGNVLSSPDCAVQALMECMRHG